MHSRFHGPFLLLLMTVGLHWKLALTDQYTWLNSPDLVNQVLPWFQFQAREWQAHKFPLWDPYHWGGQSLIGQDQPGAAYPLNWILFLLPLNDGFISRRYLDWYFVLIHYLGALFCYWLCRDLKLTRAASILAGAVFAVGGYVGTTTWPQMLNGAVWAPLVLLFFLRAARGERPAPSMAAAGAALGMSLLSGHHQAPTFIAITVGGLWLYFFLSRHQPRLRLVALGGLFAAFASLIGGLQWLPSWEYWKLALRWVGTASAVGFGDKVPYVAHARWSFHPVSLLGLIVPGIHQHAEGYVGMVALALALVAVAARFREPEVRWFGAIGLGAILFSLGGASVFHGVLYAVLPLVDKARNVSAAVVMFDLAAAVLAGLGLDALRHAAVRSGRFAGGLRVALAAIAGLIWTLLLAMLLFQGERVFAQPRPALAALAALLAAAALAAWRRDAISERAAVTALVLVALIELGMVADYDFPHREEGWPMLDKLSAHADLANLLKSQPEPIRVSFDKDRVPYNFGDWYGVEQFDGYAGVTRNIITVHDRWGVRMLLGENRWVGPKPAREGQEELAAVGGGLKVYRNPEAFPRVWTVHEAMGVPDSSRIPDQFEKPLADLRREVFVVGQPPQLERCGGPDSAEMTERGTNRVVIRANLRCRGMVVLSDTYFPGWVVKIDGRQAPIWEAYGVVRGVVVEAGEHRIEMRYRPMTVYAGGALTGLGLVALGILCRWRV